MRTVLLLLIAAIPLGSGCAAYIAERGVDLNGLTTRDQVRAEFGPPVATERIRLHGGPRQEYDEFHTRRKIAEPMHAYSCRLLAGMSFGAADLLLFPAELASQTGRLISGQTLRFWYDTEGRVRGVQLNGAVVRKDDMPFSTSAATDSANEQR